MIGCRLRRHLRTSNKSLVGDQLATEDLRLRLASGDVEAQERRLIPGGGIEIIPLTPEDFKVRDALSDDLGPFLRSFPFRGHDIFLRRADVYRIWPIAGVAWMPLSVALPHIQQVVGGHQLATEDLRLRLASGDVEAHERRVIPGGGIEVIPLTPEDFKVSDALSDDLGPLAKKLSLSWPQYLPAPRGRIPHMADEASRAASPPHQPPSNQLPTKRPKGVGPRAWLVAREVDALMREGGKDSKWIDLDDLLNNDSRADRRKGQECAERTDSGHRPRLSCEIVISSTADAVVARFGKLAPTCAHLRPCRGIVCEALCGAPNRTSPPTSPR